MPSYEYLEMKKRHPDWIWPRSDSHVVLGDPGSMECYKTWAEPGNSFSPGIQSFGVSVWIYDEDSDEWYIPENMDLNELSWRFRDGTYPVIISEWTAGSTKVISKLFKRKEGVQKYTDVLTLTLKAAAAAKLKVYLVIHSYGACGGFIGEAGADEGRRDMILNGYPLVRGRQQYDQFAAVDFSEGEHDICQYIMAHKLPEKEYAAQPDGWCSAAACYQISVKAGAETVLQWDFPNYMPHSRASQLVDFDFEPDFDIGVAEQELCEYWDEHYGSFRLSVPDEQFQNLMYGSYLHMLMMMTGEDIRIESSFYPLFWLRDGVYIINCLEKAGQHELARNALKRVMNADFAGGFGAEADAPAEGIWALYEHYRFTGDRDYLEEVYPIIARKAELIDKMINTTENIYNHSVEMVCSFIRSSMVCGLVCKPAKDGLIQGVMDHHIPLYWINCWAVMGLKLAAQAARETGNDEDAVRYDRAGRELEESLYAYYPEDFYETPELQGIYSFGAALWPTHTFPKEMVKEEFQRWWDEWRNRGGEYQPGFDWTYFEAAQAHNYLLLGEQEKFFTILNRYYQFQDVPGLYGYNEGKGFYEDGKPSYGGQDWGFGNILPYRGWDQFDCNMPHNWVSAEIFLMQRDALLAEDGDTLIIGLGIDTCWLETGEPLRVEQMPSGYGVVSYEIALRKNVVSFRLQCTAAIRRLSLELKGLGLRRCWEDVTDIRETINVRGETAHE